MKSVALRVAAIEPLSERITRFRFEHPEGKPLPVFSGGAHVIVEMEDDGTIRRNAYSLISDPMDPSGWEIAVQREDGGRGGSRFMHTRVKVGDTLHLGAPVNLFALDLRAKKHLMIAGGVGITPFLAQIRQLAHIHGRYELHYAVPTRAEAAALPLLRQADTHLHVSAEGSRLDIPALLAAQPIGTVAYVCGSAAMIAAVVEAARALGWPAHAVHSEEFLAPQPGPPFEARLARSGVTVKVGQHQSLLDAIEAAGVAAPCLCRGGVCGQCETQVLACDGVIEHHDHWLEEGRKAANDRMMICVSRFKGRELVLDL